jgi:hypothetical protein
LPSRERSFLGQTVGKSCLGRIHRPMGSRVELFTSQYCAFKARNMVYVRFALGGMYSISRSSNSSLLTSSAWWILTLARRKRGLTVLSCVFSGDCWALGGAGVWKALPLALVVLKPRGARLRGPAVVCQRHCLAVRERFNAPAGVTKASFFTVNPFSLPLVLSTLFPG